MLSSYFPAWLIPNLSWAFNLFRGKVPERWRGIAVFATCALVTGLVVAATPLTAADAVEQAVILYGIVVAGYTITAPLEGAPKGVAVGVVAGLLALVCVGVAVAQEAVPGPMQTSASILVQIGLGILNGVLGRLVKKIKA